jgi:ribosomal protein S18 acetylase RimI-like enzyme
MVSIDDLEHLAAPGWRGVEEERLGDWLLRAAGGFTGRANSALAAGDPGLPLAVAAERVRDWYRVRGLPAMIAVPYPVGEPDHSALDRLLASLGWTRPSRPATVMVAAASRVLACHAAASHRAASHRAADHRAAHHRAASHAVDGLVSGTAEVEIGPRPDEGWLARYHYRGQQLPPIALRVLTSAPWQAFASVRRDGQTVAIGRVAASGGWAGLTAIEVDPDHRRGGLGAAVTAALAGAAVRHGARRLYLQVENGNAAARALYRRIGFTDHHGYHYRGGPSSS